MFFWNEQERSAATAIGELKEAVSNRQGHHNGFFDRKVDILWLLDYLSKPPEGVLAVVGPKSCGKSALLQEVVRLWAREGVLLASHPIIYVDCTFAMGDAALAMKQALAEFLDKVQGIAGSVTVAAPGIEGSINVGDVIRTFRGKLSSASTVREMTNLFRDYLARNSRARPTLVLDEAQFMKEWPEADFNRFIGVFTALTKQNHRAHLVLCSSDDFFVDWLGKSLETGAWKVFGIGPFPKVEARLYFEYMLTDAPDSDFGDEDWNQVVEAARGETPVPTISDDCWAKVFNVCGGSPLHLRTLARSIKSEGGVGDPAVVDSCLDDVLEMAMQVYSWGFYPTDSTGWTGEHYSSVAGLIVDGGGCVGFDKIVATIFSKDVLEARKAVHAMMAANVLHLRYVSTKLTYIDMPALSKPQHRYQAMAVNPPHLAAMRAIVRDPSIIDYCE